MHHSVSRHGTIVDRPWVLKDNPGGAAMATLGLAINDIATLFEYMDTVARLSKEIKP